MIYSVWKPLEKKYAYYESLGADADILQPMPTHLKKSSPFPIGWDPDAAAWKLPSNAKPIGTGAAARGMIATTGSGALGDFFEEPSLLQLALLGAAIYFFVIKK